MSSCNDLGICIDSELRFKGHINNIVTKAHQRAALIKRCFRSRDPKHLFRAFTVYVRPLLEYNSPVWSPCYASYVNLIEKVQRRFTNGLAGFKYLSYCDRLARLNCDSLELRRLRSDLIFLYKVFYGLVDVDFSSLFNIIPHCTRGHDKKLFKPQANCNVRAHFFACRVIDVWNSLPASVVNADSLQTFCRLLLSTNLNKFIINVTCHGIICRAVTLINRRW